MTGTIKYLIRNGSGGFIKPDGKGNDVFFPRAVLKGSAYDQLQTGARVTYSTEKGSCYKAVEAVAVELIPQ